MCECTKKQLCKYHWTEQRLRDNPGLSERALDWENTGKEASAIGDMMMNYDGDRMERLQQKHRAGEP